MPARKRRKWDTDGASSSVPEFSLRVRKCAAQIRTWLANVDGALKIRATVWHVCSNLLGGKDGNPEAHSHARAARLW